jgi:hypothetical protein
MFVQQSLSAIGRDTVAGAVGEGSVTVGSVHQYLADAAAETHSASSQTH